MSRRGVRVKGSLCRARAQGRERAPCRPVADPAREIGGDGPCVRRARTPSGDGRRAASVPPVCERSLRIRGSRPGPKPGAASPKSGAWGNPVEREDVYRRSPAHARELVVVPKRHPNNPTLCYCRSRTTGTEGCEGIVPSLRSQVNTLCKKNSEQLYSEFEPDYLITCCITIL
jgi:hypothetical protein